MHRVATELGISIGKDWFCFEYCSKSQQIRGKVEDEATSQTKDSLAVIDFSEIRVENGSWL